MDREPLVSVVIATYNMGQYLPEAINSVLSQTWQNLEIIVVDDGSTDDTPRKMERFADDSRVRYVSTENRGQPRAKNRGIHEAAGEFIAFCDADDLWTPYKLHSQMEYFSDPGVGVVYSEVSYIDNHGSPLIKAQPYKRHSGNVTKHLIIKNFVPFGTAVIRKSCVDNDGYFDENLPMGIDWDLWLRYSINWKFHYVPRNTYQYRVWSGQMSRNYRGRYENAFLVLNKFIKNNPEVLSESTLARAISDMYISRGMHIAAAENAFSEPLKDIITGMRYDWKYIFGWKSLAKLLLNRARS